MLKELAKSGFLDNLWQYVHLYISTISHYNAAQSERSIYWKYQFNLLRAQPYLHNSNRESVSVRFLPTSKFLWRSINIIFIFQIHGQAIQKPTSLDYLQLHGKFLQQSVFFLLDWLTQVCCI